MTQTQEWDENLDNNGRPSILCIPGAGFEYRHPVSKRALGTASIADLY